jgi:hypothetical protein
MSTFYVAAVEGDWCERLDEVVRAWGKNPVGGVQLFDDWGSVSSRSAKKGCLVAARSGGWTVLTQDDLVFDLLDDRIMAAMHARLGTRVVVAFADDTCGQLGFRL